MANQKQVIRACLLYEFKLSSNASEICMVFGEDTIPINNYYDKLGEVQGELREKQPTLFCSSWITPDLMWQRRLVTMEFEWEIMFHPPYSPDPSPTDFHLFLNLDSYTRNKQFNNENNLKKGVLRFF
uniref:HTH_48 domain-containing protein n=1 Tax=Heterorhabditis bacteriophora TaxID=37862 RepID=A0A1I7W9S7_HETBA